MELTIGMATYRDFDGVYFTLQALRLHHDLEGVELLVVDNYGCSATRDLVENWAGGRYVLDKDAVGTAAPRNVLFREAQGEAVLCLDCHVLLVAGTVARLKRYYRDNPDSLDLLQGPLVYDDLRTLSSHFEPVWRDQMWGIWALDERAEDPESEPFEIPMQGLGLFSCRKAAWPGFNAHFRGFGGEEGYIHQKFRNLGRRCLCLPWLRWIHRFGRPQGVLYPLRLLDRITNYLIGHRELGLDEAPVLEHFRATATEAEVQQALQNADAVQPRAVVPESSPAILRTPPLISCLCPTFGRCGAHWQHLLEEAVESFLRQTDTHSELLILNDHPNQEVVFDHPRVCVLNLKRRFRTLGEKYNALIGLASGDLFAPWNDDDISLPHRLALSRESLAEYDYFNPRRYWFLDGAGLHQDHPMGVGHNLSLFRRRAWASVGGYPIVSGSEDAGMDARLTGSPDVACWADREPLAVKDWYYIYRWGVSPCHLSSCPDMQGFYNRIGATPVEAGRFTLNPHWQGDYVRLVADSARTP